jgi:hypothetical protein
MNDVCQKKRSGHGAVFIIVIFWLILLGAAGVRGAEPENGGIAGRVFLDENADAVFKDADCGLENIPVRLYHGDCGGLIIQTVHTDAEGYFHFLALEAGDYCLMPMPKLICEGFQPTGSITQKVRVRPGETTQAEWFSFDHFFDINE